MPANAAIGSWDPSFGPSQPDGPIRDAIVFHGEPYFGGDFLVAGRRDTPYVAKFVAGRWVKPLGYPIGPVFDFLERDGTLYIAGALATPAFYKSYVAYHDGQNWLRLGNLFTVPIQGLAVLSGELFAFGQGIFRWDGTNWVQEPGITTGSVLWMAELNGVVYASHLQQNLFRRENGSWVHFSAYFFTPECVYPFSSDTGQVYACVQRSDRLLLLGDFWAVRETESGTETYSSELIGFDGSNFSPEEHPWTSRCEGNLSVASRISHAAGLGDPILAVGVFVTDPHLNYYMREPAYYDGQTWHMLEQFWINPTDPRVLHSAGQTWIAAQSMARQTGEGFVSLGRIAEFDVETQDLLPVFESTVLGVRSQDKGSGQVTCLTAHRDAVVFGGTFATQVGKVGSRELPPIYAIAGQTERSIITPVSIRPSALLSTARGLYAADENAVVRIGEGEDREVLISNLLGYTYVMAEQGDALLLGGAFGALNGVAVTNLARLHNGNIEAFGEPDGPVRALAYFQGDWIAAGDFTHIGGIEAQQAARWNGTQWSPMGEPFTRALFGAVPHIRALCVWNGVLHAGGNFLGTETQDFGNIAKWTAEGWQPLTALDLQAPVNALVVHEDRLIAGGEFLYAGNVFMGPLTAFDGTSWIDLGARANGNVFALASFDGDLYVGGNFSILGGWNSYGIARWRLAPRPEPEVPPRYYWFTGVQPNPFNPQASLIFQIPAPGPVEIEIFDNRGRLVRRIDKPWSVAGELRIEWDGRDDAGQPVASGSYQFRASYGGETQTRSAVLVR